MGVFTRLGDAELGAIAATFSLGEVRRWEAIAAGTINSNFAVETAPTALSAPSAPSGPDAGPPGSATPEPSGPDAGPPGSVTPGPRRWFVRVNEGKAEADVAWEAQLVEALAAGGLPTPPPRRAADARPYAPLRGAASKWVSVFPWRAGRHLAPAEVTAAHAGALGEALAALHAIGAALPEAWRRASIYDHDHLVARYRGFAGSPDPQLARAIAVLGEELALAEAAAPVRRAASAGIIHGDLFRDNVLWDGTRVAALLDFEQASGGSFAYDLAVCMNDWCWDPEAAAPRIELAGALLAGYQRRRALPQADRAALPVELRAAAARFTITRITDVYLAKVDNPEKDFRAFLARCEAWRGPALGQVTALL